MPLKRGRHIKPEFRDLPNDELVDVTFSKKNADGLYEVTSPALTDERHYTDITHLPFPVQHAMAQTAPRPTLIRPTTVPEARVDMFDMAVDLWRRDVLPDNPDYSAKAMQWVAETLADADLYWVSPEMCELLTHAAPALPPTTLTPDLLPSESGVVFFADSLLGADAQDPENEVWVSALVWGPCQFDITTSTRKEGDSQVVIFGGHNVETGEDVRFLGNGTSISTWRKWERWVPLGRTDWPNGFDTEGEFAPTDFTPRQLASIIEDRRWLAAFAILSRQEKITYTTVVDTERHAAKRLRRRNITPPKVRLVDIHKPKHVTSGKTRDVEWANRWIVKGFWRQQAYGPQRQFRRPTYIQPFIKGPADKPLKVSPEIVKVWRH